MFMLVIVNVYIFSVIVSVIVIQIFMDPFAMFMLVIFNVYIFSVIVSVKII